MAAFEVLAMPGALAAGLNIFILFIPAYIAAAMLT